MVQEPLSSPKRPEPDVDLPPPNVPNHQVFQCIGRGAYGMVWLARNTVGEWRAVKAVYRRRFANNARAYRREYKGIKRYSPVSLRHESMLPILQVGRDNLVGCFYCVMELADHVDGSRPRSEKGYEPKTLKRVMVEPGRLPTKDCVFIVTALAEALARLHAEKLIHRDVKPANIVFVHGRPKLADIGLVTDLDETQTEAGGTPGYFSPERFGKPEGDIYALGKVLYEMATGCDRLKFPELPTFRGMSEEEHRRLLDLNDVFTRACAILPQERPYRSVDEMLNDLLLLKADQSLVEQRRWRRWQALTTKYGPWAVAAVIPVVAAVAFWIQHQRAKIAARLAAELARQREVLIANGRLARPKQDRLNGWSKLVWSNSFAAARIQLDDLVRGEAMTALAGPDAHRLFNFPNTPATAAAFDGNSNVLVASDDTNNAVLITRDGIKQILPVRARGPTCWAPGDVPLQFVGSNILALLDMRSNEVRRTFPLASGEHVMRVDAHPVLAMTRNGSKVAASLVSTQTARIVAMDSLTGESIGEVTEVGTALAFSPDGELLAVGKGDGSVGIYSLPQMSEFSALPILARPGPVLALAFSRDRMVRYDDTGMTNRWCLAVGHKSGRLVVWDVNSSLPRTTFNGSQHAVLSVAFHPDGLTLASAGRTEARLWDTMTGNSLLTLTEQGGDAARALAFNDDGSRLAWGSESGFYQGSVGVWGFESDRGILVLRGLSSNTRWVWFSPDSRRLAALADDWTLGVFEIPSGRLLWLFEVPIGITTDNAGGAFDATGEHFAFATGREARRYDLATGRVTGRWKLNHGLSDQLQFDELGRLLLLRREAKPGQVKTTSWRLQELSESATPQLLFEQTDTNWISYITLLSVQTGRFIVMNGGSGPVPMQRIIKVFDLATGKEQRTLPTDIFKGDLKTLLDPTGNFFAFPSVENRMRLLRLADLQDLGEIEYCSAIDATGTRLVRSTGPGIVVQDQAAQFVGASLGIDWHAAFFPFFSPNGEYLAWGTSEGVVLVADLKEVARQQEALELEAR